MRKKIDWSGILKVQCWSKHFNKHQLTHKSQLAISFLCYFLSTCTKKQAISGLSTFSVISSLRRLSQTTKAL